jgi:methionine biosynthesis protein MetW
MNARLRTNGLISDYDQVVSLVPPGSSVLDLGCGNGELLQRLIRERDVRGAGVEISEDAVIECLHKGLSVFQGDLDEGLADYGDASYDYVVLDQTLQVIRRPAFVISEMLRVGKRAIISFPNFGHWSVRAQLLFRGRMPRTSKLPFEWHDTPNIHLLTLRDFRDFCRRREITVLQELHLRHGRRLAVGSLLGAANWLADEGVFVLGRRGPA